jgi:REP element-mobilizing transposase RayT
MPRIPRRELLSPDEIAIVHCVNRCVRRAFLCGTDSHTGRSFDHRKDWVRDRLQELAGIFAVDVLGYTVMSNHFHVVLRNRPDVAADWSDEDVARRWWRLFPARRDDSGAPAELLQHELDARMAGRAVLAEWRRRLSDVSWFMRCLAEPIARRANREDNCRGRFFEGRFKAQALLDESALVACSAYVDLNPIRAGIASTPERSLHTSIHDRIESRRQAAAPTSPAESPKPSPSLASTANQPEPTSPATAATQPPAQTPDAWLAPVELAELPAPIAHPRSPRASDNGFLPMSLDEYLSLVDWTGRQIHRRSTRRIPSQLKPILERLKVIPECWLQTVKEFGRRFRRVAGRADSLSREALRRRSRWLHGTRPSRLAFAAASGP